MYIPNPLRCFRCQKFGHNFRTCKGAATCSSCGRVGHDATGCQNPPKCANCTGAHSASSKECPKWAFGKKVQAVKTKKGVSFIKARRIVTTEQKLESGTRAQLMAAVVRAGGGQQRPTTRSTCMQTNLTWPDNQEALTLVYALASALSQTKSSQRAPSQTSAKFGRHDESRSPFRPPRKSPNSRKRQPSAHDRPLETRPKIRRPPRVESADRRPFFNRFNAS